MGTAEALKAVKKKHMVFVQNRSKRAGAQVSLSRIATNGEIQSLAPFVVLGENGWLENFLTERGVPHDVRPWPSPRSAAARLGGLGSFARRTITELGARGITPSAIIANDHQETPVALALAKAAGGAPVAVILRTPGMSERDFEKYGCGKCELIFARGEELTARTRKWSEREVTCMLGSFSDEDFYPPNRLGREFPDEILVVGSEETRKGFADVLAAVEIIERTEPAFPAVNFVFTGENTAQLSGHSPRSEITFVGRITKFAEFAREFQLAIHPSHAESFGMAPLELMLAGVPTMASETGIISSLPLAAPWIFPPRDPSAIARNLVQIWKQWPHNSSDLSGLQDHIREHYHISTATTILAEKLREITGGDTIL